MGITPRMINDYLEVQDDRAGFIQAYPTDNVLAHYLRNNGFPYACVDEKWWYEYPNSEHKYVHDVPRWYQSYHNDWKRSIHMGSSAIFTKKEAIKHLNRFLERYPC